MNQQVGWRRGEKEKCKQMNENERWKFDLVYLCSSLLGYNLNSFGCKKSYFTKEEKEKFNWNNWKANHFRLWFISSIEML